MQRWLADGAFEVVACPTLLAEVHDVLTKRPRLRRWIELDVAEEFCSTIATYATIVADPTDVAPTLRDAGDDYLVALARTHHLDWIVTGDQDPLDWNEATGLAITPSQFEQRLAGQNPNPQPE